MSYSTLIIQIIIDITQLHSNCKAMFLYLCLYKLSESLSLQNRYVRMYMWLLYMSGKSKITSVLNTKVNLLVKSQPSIAIT